MTSEEKQEIINAVLAALRTNSKTIDQLTPISEMSDEDFLELNGGRKVSYGVLFANHMSNEDAQEAMEYLDTKKVDKDSRGLVEVHQAPVVFLDAMGNLDGHSLNGSDGLEYRTDTKLIYDFPGGLLGAPKARAVYISKNNFKKFVWNGTDLVELKADECPLFVDYMVPVAFADIPVGCSYYVQSSHKIAVKIDASNTKTYDPLPDALYFFRDKGMIYTWKSSTNKWVPAGSDIKVVNNLTEGGKDDALSAEQGKVLKGLIDNMGTDATQGEKLKGIIVSLATLVNDALKKLVWTDDDGQDITDSIQDIIDELTAPVIYTDLSSLSFATTTGVPVTKTIKVHGGNLTADISLVVSGTGFSIDKQTISKDAGETIVTVTYNPSATGTNTGNIVISSTGATSVTVSLSGEAVTGPSIAVNVNSLSMSSVDGAAVTDTFKVTPINLSNDITLSVSGTGFSIDKQTISKDAGETTVTVTYAPSASGTHTGTITIESVGVSSKTISLSGTSTILTAVFSSTKQIYTSDTLDWLKQFITVKDGGVTVSSWSLSGTLTVGTSALTVGYNNRTVQINISNVLAGVASFYNFVNRAVFSYQFPETYVTGTNNKRTVYPGMDKHMPGGVSYTFIAECNYNTAQFGIAFYNQNVLDAYEGSYEIVGTGNVWDSTWKSPGDTFTPDASVNNSVIVGARINCRVDTNNSDIPNDFLIERVVLIQA